MTSIKKIFLDTDLGNDIDDVLALAMLHKFHSTKKIDLLGICSSNSKNESAGFIEFLNLFYGNNLKIGLVRDGIEKHKSKYLHLLPLLKELYPHIANQMQANGKKWQSSEQTLKTALENTADDSVDLLMIGFSTNIARFLQDDANNLLAHNKINKIVCMAGQFPSGPKEYNIKSDSNSFLKLIEIWKKKIDFIGFELGFKIEFSMADIEMLEKQGLHYPLTLSYRAYKNGIYTQPCWDPLATLYCVFNSVYFSSSENGKLILNQDLSTKFDFYQTGLHRYVIIEDYYLPIIKKQIMDCLLTQ